MQQSIIFERSELSTLKTIQVSSPVKVDKKLSIAQIVGDFSLIPTNAIDQISLIGSRQLDGISIPLGTKSAKKGWRLTAKW